MLFSKMTQNRTVPWQCQLLVSWYETPLIFFPPVLNTQVVVPIILSWPVLENEVLLLRAAEEALAEHSGN